MVQKNLRFISVDQPCVVAYTLDNNANGDSWNRILVVYNGNRRTITLNIPQANWIVVCNGDEVNLKGIFKQNKTELRVPGSSAMILYKE